MLIRYRDLLHYVMCIYRARDSDKEEETRQVELVSSGTSVLSSHLLGQAFT